MSHPYSRLPRDGIAFWQPAVGARNPLEIKNLWQAKWKWSQDDRAMTAGSCFAQHIGNALRKHNLFWLDAEPAPKGLSETVARQYGYGVFSFRTGNIYTAALLRQWIEWALNANAQSDECWLAGDRAFDPFRPAIEPNGFANLEEMRAARDVTLAAIRTAIETATIFVFTLGLTEAWVNRKTGVVYPMCPGTLAGTFEDDRHLFRNYRYASIHEDMSAVISATQRVNPNLRFLLTVSPVPLTATASGYHVLVATTYSKSVLRAVAGDLCSDFDCVDYFPSYEIITAPVFRGVFYQPNAREVSTKGVEFVMSHLFGHETPEAAPARKKAQPPASPLVQSDQIDDVQCEEALLDAFGSQ